MEVHQETVEDMTSSVVTYRLQIEPDDLGLRIQYDDWQLQVLQGTPVEVLPEEIVAAITAMGSIFPDLMVSGEGTFLGMGDLGESLDEVLDMVAAEATPEQAEEMRTAFTSPEALEDLERGLADTWSEWVQIWLGHPLPSPGASVDLPELGEGAVLQNHGEEDRINGEIRLELHRMDPEEAANIAAVYRDSMPEVEDLDISVLQHHSVVLKPKTMQPTSVTKTRVVSVSLGGEVEEQSAMTTYTFAWGTSTTP